MPSTSCSCSLTFVGKGVCTWLEPRARPVLCAGRPWHGKWVHGMGSVLRLVPDKECHVMAFQD